MNTNVEYIIFYIDEYGYPEEWAASSTDFEDAYHYLKVYSKDGDVGLFFQQEPAPVLVDGKPLTLKEGCNEV